MVQQKSSTRGLFYKQIKTDQTRDLLLRVCDGIADLAPLLFYINSMNRCDDACRWLIKSNLTGKNLYAFWWKESDKSYLNVMATINKGLEHDDKLRPIFVGRDL